MSSQQEFVDFMVRVRQGDERAAEELVRRYEPLIRREIRGHLEDSRLTRALDSVDISQSVLASFFVRVAAGEYDLHDPSQLVHLLVKMARNKLISRARWQFSQKRDARRVEIDSNVLQNLPDDRDSPSQHVSGRELLESLVAKLSVEERHISELRGNNLTWEDVAGRLGGTPHGRRMQLARAIERVSRELGLDD